METLIKSIIEISIYSSFMIILVLLIRAIWQTKVDLKIIFVLWILVLARLVLPFTIDSPMHFDKIFPNAEKVSTVNSAENYTNGLDSDNSNIEEINLAEDYLPSNNAPELTINTTTQTQSNPSYIDKAIKYIEQISIWTYLFVIWFVGFVVFLFINLYSVFEFYCRVSTCKQIESGVITKILLDNKAKIDLTKSIKIIRCKYVGMPVTFGWIKPKILIPHGFEMRISEDKLRLVLLHELYHIKRNDILKNYLWLFAKVLHWFNPLVWIAYKEYLDDIEFAVDNTIIRNSNKYIAKEYSQSIIDVIRISNRMCNVPLALSFCKDKNKLRKRVENMIKPKKNQFTAGIITVILSVIMTIACFTTACQPTQANLTERNSSNTEELPTTTEQAKDENYTTEEIISEVTEQLAEPEIIVENTAANESGSVTINTSAIVYLPDTENIPVASIVEEPWTQDMVDNILHAYFGKDVEYIEDVFTKADIMNTIEIVKESATNLDSDMAQSNGIDNLEDLQKEADREITELEAMYSDAPSENTKVDSFNISNDTDHLFLQVETGQEYHANIFYNNSDVFKQLYIFNFNSEYNLEHSICTQTSTPIELDFDNSEFQSAKATAQKLIDEIGIDGVKLTEGFLSLDQTNLIGPDQEYDGVVSDQQFYVFFFDRVVNDMTVAYTQYLGTRSEDENTDPLPYEKLSVWIKGNDVVQFYWISPMKIDTIITDSAEIQYDYNSIINIANEQLINENEDMWYSKADSINIEITKMELVLARVKDPNTNTYTVTPVWDIYGDVIANIPEENVDDRVLRKTVLVDNNNYLLNDNSLPLLTINAIDNTIVDRELGY